MVRLEGGTITAHRDFKTRRGISRAVQALAPGAHRVFIEAVHAMPGEGVCSVFSFGKSTGTALGAIDCCHREDVIEIAPQRWQNFFRVLCGIDKKTRFKDVTREVAARIFPAQKELFARQKDHNTADAALLAAYGARHLP